MPNDKLLQVRNLKKYFDIKRGFFWGEPAKVHAVDGVTFDLLRGETLGLVGESGCGKSTTGRLILRLIEPTAGEILFEQTPILQTSKSEMRALRQRMQIIFQDPYSSLNPRMTVEQIVGEGIVIHKLCKTRQERRERVADLLQKVGLSPEQMHRYPHEFSGGQRQRVGIARALAMPTRLGGEPETDHRRRTDLRARRLDPGAGHQPAGGSAGSIQFDLPLHRP
jgi:oligopeptide transport system ATP-binding protein